MKMYSIEIDQEVFEYLKRKAEPFVDTPNSVLRRELIGRLGTSSTSPPTASHVISTVGQALLPKTPPGIPKALEHILQVVYLVRTGGKKRIDATQYVAKIHGITTQAVLDKYCRQLDLQAFQFDTLLAQADLQHLKDLLRKKFGRHAAVTESYLTPSPS